MAHGESALRFTPEQREAAMAVFAECSDLREFGCRVLEATMNAMMDAEAQRQCGAARGERSEGRTNSRNGHGARSLKTSVGDLSLEVPKLRRGTHGPEGLLGRHARVEASMVALVQETCVAGVSTRKVERVSEALGAGSPSGPEASGLCGGLDAEVGAFRSRDLGGRAYPYVWLDATYMKCRVGGRYVSRGLVTAIGMSEGGHKEFLGCDRVDTEPHGGWRDFPRACARGARPGCASSPPTTTPARSGPSRRPSAAARGRGARGPGGQEGRGRPGQGRHDAARPAGRPGRVGGGLPLGRPGLGGGRQGLRLGARGRAGLHVLPRGALAQGQDQQRPPTMRTGP